MATPFRPLLAASLLLTLLACQGIGAGLGPVVLGNGSGSAPPAPTPTPPSGACAALAIVIPDAGGALKGVTAGYEPPGTGRCVPVRDLASGRVELLSVGGGYRLTLELPGRPSAAGGPVLLRVALRYGSGSQPAIADAPMFLRRQAVGEAAAADEPLAQAGGAYTRDGLTWSRTGLWLVTVAFTVGGAPDEANLAVDVGI